MQEYCFTCAVEEHVRTALNGTTYALQPRVFVGKLKRKIHIQGEYICIPTDLY